MDGSQWIPYQRSSFPTPPFPDYVSGHSAFSAAAARVLTLWTGVDHFGYSVMLAAGSSRIEPGDTPAKPVVLSWETFTEAADEAGLSRRFGGIHFARADLAGRKLGRLVADRAWAKAQTYFDGSNSSPVLGIVRTGQSSRHKALSPSFPPLLVSGPPGLYALQRTLVCIFISATPKLLAPNRIYIGNFLALGANASA
jgi:hypothetical protein